ncbi:DegT/DnrJ/EryC1/StrS aminotransferase family protein [Chlorobium sp. KB01]|uniref:DegT/DnrJ/EryC1/StrS family aminotransferase n=1 Tax=Chlorobium sp. KB01 TaxID=1917528 RepID=UPI00097662B1|nr:DegT/DnrJ/EryC1/StrS family aminotransferase [Chlorobium sp. KB01]
MTDFIPFFNLEIGEDEIAEVVDSLRAGWVTTGPKVNKFEKDFAEFIGGGVEAIAVNSATSGLHLALEAVGVGQGDEVITVSYTFTATAEVIRYLDAKPVFVDVDPETYCIDVAAIEDAITPKTKAIIPVHFGGLSADMGSLIELAKRHNLHVVEDAAHALPTTYDGQLIGTLDTDATVFSFYSNKTMTTGEGGMLVTRNPALSKRVRMMRLHGISKDVFNRFNSKAPAWYYEILAPGFKYNMTDIAACLGIHQLKKVRAFHEHRTRIAEAYDAKLADLPLRLPPKPRKGEQHSWHLYVICLAEGLRIGRDEFIQKMFEMGIGCSVHYIPLHLQPYWRETYGLSEKMFPNSQRIYDGCVSLPIYPIMTMENVQRVTSTIQQLLDDTRN